MSDDKTPKDEIVFKGADGSKSTVDVTPQPFTKGETLFLGGFAAAIIAAFGAIVYAGIKEEARQEEEYRLRLDERLRNREAVERWLNDQENSGNKVYTLKDGRYLSVDREANQSTHLVTQIQESYRNRVEEI